MNHLHTDDPVNHREAHGAATGAARKSVTGAARKSVTVIFNPVAGGRRRRKLIEVVEAMTGRGAIVTLRETRGPGHAQTLARDIAAAGGADIVVAAGGDGTINEVANGLAGTKVPLGIIPIGTANVLAIETGMPRGSDALGELLLTGRERTIGGGRINGRFFLLWAGAGFDGRLVHAIDPALKRKVGKLAFVWAGLKAFAAGPGAPVAVSDGTQRLACGWAIAANAVHYAGRYRLAPSARFETVGLVTLAVPMGGRLGMLAALVALALGRLERLPGVTVLRGRDIAIEPVGAAPEPVQVDGDDMLTLPVHIECWDPAKAPQIRLVMP